MVKVTALVDEVLFEETGGGVKPYARGNEVEMSAYKYDGDILMQFGKRGDAYLVEAEDLRAVVRMLGPEEAPSPPRALAHSPWFHAADNSMANYGTKPHPMRPKQTGALPAAVSEWYRVEDRLPDTDLYVLVRIETKQADDGWAVVRAKRDRHGHWFSLNAPWGVVASRITHWAYYPSFDDKDAA